MLQLQNTKTFIALKQEAATNGATLTSDNIDTLGFGEVLIEVHSTTSNNATNNCSVLKVQECDTTVASSFADITAAVGDGASGFTIANAATATSNTSIAKFHGRCGGSRKRYLRVLISPLTTQTFSVIAQLGRAEQTPDTITERGTDVFVTF